MTPEGKVRQQIVAILVASGWARQTKNNTNLSASRGIAVCEFSFATSGSIYTLFVNGMVTRTGDRIRPCREAGLRKPDSAMRDDFVQTLWRAVQSESRPGLQPESSRRTAQITGQVAGQVEAQGAQAAAQAAVQVAAHGVVQRLLNEAAA